MEADGSVRRDTATAACTFTPTISEVFPSPIPTLGGGIMKITGTGFFQNAWQKSYAKGEAASASITVTIAGVASTVRSVTATTVECIIPDISATAGANADVIVTQNAQASTAKSVVKSNTPNLLLTVDTLTASPVDKISIALTLDTSASTLPATNDDFIGMLVNEAETYRMRITSFTPSTGAATMKFPGAVAGIYNFYLADNSGNSLSNPKVFTSESKMTSVTPSSGSVFGGTRITIAGVNFPTGTGDVIVKIGSNICTIVSQERDKLVVDSPERGATDIFDSSGA